MKDPHGNRPIRVAFTLGQLRELLTVATEAWAEDTRDHHIRLARQNARRRLQEAHRDLATRV